MGLTFSSILDTLSSLTRWTKEKDVRILMLGLDSAGKVRVADQFLAGLENGDLTVLAVDDDFIQVTGTSPLLPSTRTVSLKRATARLERLFQQYQVSSRPEDTHESH